jgi:glucosyl-dolichyl phosphate glucuronosyltransferase
LINSTECLFLMNKKVSIIVRTNKREILLKELLGTIIKMNNLKDCEILIVDNDSQRSAESIAQFYMQKNPVSIKYFVLPVQSASGTANKGIRESKGDIIAFIDDDAIPAGNWFEEVKKSFEDKTVAIVGGRILLFKEEVFAERLNEPVKRMLGKLDIGGEFRKMGNKEFPLLMNLAARREVFDKVGLFPEKLGYQKGKPLAGEETAFVIAARKKGYDIYYNPDMVVYHRINPERLKSRFFIRKKYWEGRAVFITNRLFYPLFYVVLIFFFRVFVFVPLLTLLFLLSFFDKKRRFTIILLCKIFRNIGYGVQAFR